MGKELINKEVFQVDLKAKVEEFKNKNKDFDLDFVELGTHLKLTKTGKFQSKDDEKVIFDNLTCVILSGRSQYVLWGKEGTPNADELLISADNIEDAVNVFESLATDDETFKHFYTLKDIKARYIITLIAEDGELYAINMSSSSKSALGNYSKSCIKKGLGFSDVITKITTAERVKGKLAWVVLNFEIIESRKQVK